jgi:hypothetical protein
VLTGLGTVTALNTAAVRSQITGLLVSVDFKEGQLVKKGDLLAQIDPRTSQAQLDESEATLAHDQVHLKNGELNLQRYTELVKQDSAAVQQRDNQQAAVDELDAQITNDRSAVEYAKTQLSYTRLVVNRLPRLTPCKHPTGTAYLDRISSLTLGLYVGIEPVSWQLSKSSRPRKSVGIGRERRSCAGSWR